MPAINSQFGLSVPAAGGGGGGGGSGDPNFVMSQVFSEPFPADLAPEGAWVALQDLMGSPSIPGDDGSVVILEFPGGQQENIMLVSGEGSTVLDGTTTTINVRVVLGVLEAQAFNTGGGVSVASAWVYGPAPGA